MCEKFARKASKKSKNQEWFCRDEKTPTSVNTRGANKKLKLQYLTVETRTKRYKKSPLPYLTDILNKDVKK